MSIAIANCAIVVFLDESLGRFADVRISLGSVAPTPIRAVKAEDFLKGKPVDAVEMEKAADLARVGVGFDVGEMRSPAEAHWLR